MEPPPHHRRAPRAACPRGRELWSLCCGLSHLACVDGGSLRPAAGAALAGDVPLWVDFAPWGPSLHCVFQCQDRAGVPTACGRSGLCWVLCCRLTWKQS